MMLECFVVHQYPPYFIHSCVIFVDAILSKFPSLILLLGLDPWPLDPLDPPKFFKDFLFFKKF